MPENNEHENPASIRGKTVDDISRRRALTEKITGADLKKIGSFSISPESASKNIENMIGTIQIPVGIAGPLKIKGEYTDGEYYVPLATTEGALVASVNRGMRIIGLSGGARTMVLQDNMTRAPGFRTGSITEARALVRWVEEHYGEVKEKAEATTSHGKLLKIDPFVVGRHVFLRFYFFTGEAMGMNIVTIASEAASNLIAEKTGATLVTMSGNMCVDKKPSAMNLILGRGKHVQAEVVIPETVVAEKLHTTPSKIVDVSYIKNFLGSARSGALGFNAQYANIVAATFLATGQDAAHVVEGSAGITTVEMTKSGDLYVAVSLPSLPVGTVGGGTHVDTQREALNIMGCFGKNSAKKLAEIIGGAVLAGEISLMGAQAAGDLGKAHKSLGR